MLKCLLFLPSSWFRSWMVCLHEGSWGLLSHDCWNYSRKKQHRIRTQQKKHCSLLMLPSLPKVWKKNKKVESPKFIPPSRDVPGSYMWVKIQVSHGFFLLQPHDETPCCFRIHQLNWWSTSPKALDDDVTVTLPQGLRDANAVTRHGRLVCF